MNKQLLSVLSVIISVALALGIYLYFAKIEDKSIRPVQVVPDNAAIIFESNNSSSHLKSLADPIFMERLLGNEHIAGLYSQLNFYDSLIKTHEDMAEWFSKGQAVYSFHTFNNKTFGFFMAVQTMREVMPSEMLAFFQQHFPDRYKLSKRKFMNEDLYDFTDFKDGTHFTIAFKSKLMLFSPDGSLVELSLIKIGQQISGPILEDKLAFVKNSGNGMNLYLNYSKLPGMLRSVCHDEYVNSFSILGNFAERAVYNIALEEQDILLKGAAQTHESQFQYLDLLNAQAPIANNLREILPDDIHFAYTLGFNGYPSFHKNVNEYLLSRNLFNPYKAYADSIEKELQFPFMERLQAQLANHAALISMDEPGMWKDSCYITAIECANEAGMDALLHEMERSVQRKNASDTNAVVMDSSAGDISKAYFGDVFKYCFTDLFAGMDAKYYIKYQGYYFFANNPGILRVLKQSQTEQKLLSKDPVYKNVQQNLSPNSNLEILILNTHAPKYALNFLNKDWFSLLNQNMGTFKRADLIAVQFAGSNDKIFATQIYSHFNTSQAEKTEQIWAVPLDTVLISKPRVMFHYGLGAQVILVQDAKMQLYMLDREGKILWKQKLDNPILSAIEELDLFNNGKRQWMFNTSRYIYLIDENGVAVSGWPVWIPTGTAYPVSVFDPNKDRNYQIFTSGLFFKVSAFNTQARLLPFWNPKEVWPNFKSRVGNFLFGNQQVYWALNEKGEITFLNNQAKPFDKIKLDSHYRYLDVHIQSVDTGEIQITALDSSQLIHIRYFSSKPAIVQTQAAMDYQHFSLLTGPGSETLYLLQSDSKMLLTDNQNKEIIYKDQLNGSLNDPAWINLGNSYKLVYHNNNTHQLFVENAKGENYKPFPMTMNQPHYAIGNLFNEADNWLIFADEKKQLNLYRIK